MFPAYDRRFEPLLSNNNNNNNGPFRNNQFLPPFQQQQQQQQQQPQQQNNFNRLNYFHSTKSFPKPIKVEVIKPKEKTEEKIEEKTKIVEKEIKTAESLKRERRTAQTLIPQQIYYSPYNVYPNTQYLSQPVVSPLAQLYQPQYYYNPLVRPELRNFETLITKPVYTMTDAMNIKARESGV